MSNLYDEYDSPTHKPKPYNGKSGGYQIKTIIGSGKMDSAKMAFNKHDANERYRALCIIKDLIGASRDLALKDKSCYSDDEFLYRFLFARKFNVTEAFQLLINYQNYRQKNHELLQRLCVLDDTIQMALRDGFPGVLKNRDRRGRKVLVFFTSNWDYTQYSLLTIYRAMLLTLEKLLENKQNQANGFVAIVDWTNFTLRQSAHLNPKILKLMIEGLQVCLENYLDEGSVDCFSDITRRFDKT
jgi:CRAL/TRIO domain/CRAL/TRIO, N-terminal domain